MDNQHRSQGISNGNTRQKAQNIQERFSQSMKTMELHRAVDARSLQELRKQLDFSSTNLSIKSRNMLLLTKNHWAADFIFFPRGASPCCKQQTVPAGPCSDPVWPFRGSGWLPHRRCFLTRWQDTSSLSSMKDYRKRKIVGTNCKYILLPTDHLWERFGKQANGSVLVGKKKNSTKLVCLTFP